MGFGVNKQKSKNGEGIDDDPPANRDRSVSPIVGIVLLFGMVFVGAAVVATAGMVLMDDLESASAAEQTEQCTMETDHRIATVLSHGGVKQLPCDGGQYVSDGTLYLVWHDGTAGPNMLTTFANSTAKIDELGALEYTIDEQTYAYQAGGTWKGTGTGIEPLSGPAFSYQSGGDSGTSFESALEINPIIVDGQAGAGDPSKLSRGTGDETTFDSAQRAAERNGYANLTLIVESKYHTGWKRHFESSMTGPNVNIDAGNNLNIVGVNEEHAVTVDIANAIDPEPRFEIVSDNGLFGQTAPEPDVYVTQAGRNTNMTVHNGGAGGNKLRVSADIKNTGVQTGDTTATFKIPGTSIEEPVTVSDVAPGQTSRVEFVVDYGDVASDNLKPGEIYEYNISTGDDYLDAHGSFLYATQEEADLLVENPRVDGLDASSAANPVLADGETVSLTVDVHNIGGSSVTAGELTLSMPVENASETDPYNLADSSYTVDRQYGENATVTWELNRSSLLESAHEFTVNAVNNDSEATGHFIVENGVEIGDTELRLDPGTQVNATIAGTEMSDANRGGSTGEHTVGHPIADNSAGSFTTDLAGMSYNFDAPEPNSEDDEMAVSNDGGWVAPDGTKPVANCEDVNAIIGCPPWEESEWSWDTDELVWNDDAGYELTWEDGGDWGWDGPTSNTIVPAGNDGVTIGESTRTLPKYDVEWLPGSATLITQAVDQNNDPVDEPVPIDGVDWHGTNLNVEKDATRPIFEHSFRTNDRVSFQMEASSHLHGGAGFCGGNPTETTYEIVDGSVYANEYCPGSGAVTGGDYVNLNADTSTESTNVRVLQNGDRLPTIESGSEWQRDVDELLGRDEVDVSVRNDGTLDLAANEFIFVFELTHHPEQNNRDPTVDADISPDEYWELAQTRNGDPNFNDMLVHVEINPPEVPDDFEFDGSYDGGSGAVDIGPGSSDGTGGSGSDSGGIDVGSDEIIIG